MTVLKRDDAIKNVKWLDYYLGIFQKVLCSSTTLIQSFIARGHNCFRIYDRGCLSNNPVTPRLFNVLKVQVGQG